MVRRVFKAFMNYLKEEKWLNSMSKKGLQMTGYNFLCYTFKEGEPGEYIYRIELLKELPGHPESAAYLKFMEESGVEVVATYLRWAYFRKKASEGAFEIYTDRKGKIKHAGRVIALIITLFALNFGIACWNLGLGLTVRGSINAYVSVVGFLVAAFLLAIIISQLRIIGQLKKNEEIEE